MKSQSGKLRHTVWDLAKLNLAYADAYTAEQWDQLQIIAEERRLALWALQREGKI